MSTQPIDSDTDKSSDEFRFEEPTAGSVFAQSLATSSLQELEEKPFSPERYFQMKDLPPMSYVMQEAILLGLSQGDYERVASSFAGGFGLSQSPISERFIERSAKALEEFETRSLKASKKRSRSIV